MSSVRPRLPLGVFADRIAVFAIGVVVFDKVEPVVLHRRRSSSIDLAILITRRRTVDVVGAPESVQLNGVRNTQSRGHLVRILDIPSIDPRILSSSVHDRADIHAGTHITSLLVYITGMSPVAANCRAARVRVGIHLVNLSKHVQSEHRILIQYITVALLEGGGVFGGKLGPSVGIIAIDGRYLDKPSLLEHSVCEVLYEFLIQNREPHIVGWVSRSRKRNIKVLCLKLDRRLIAHASEVVFANTTYTSCKLSVHVLRLSHRESRGERWGLCDCSIEKPSVDPIIGSQVVCNTGGASTASSQSDMVRVATKPGDVLLHPFQHFALVPKAVVGENFITVRHEAVRANTVIEAHNYNIVAAVDDQARGIGVGI